MSEYTVSSGTEFSDIGANDIELGMTLYNATGLGHMEMKDPANISKLKEVAEFFENHPDPIFAINSVKNSNKNPNVNNLEHLLTYVRLQKEKFSLLNKIEDLKNQLKYYE